MADAACAGVGVGEFFGPDAAGRRWCRCCAVVECCFWWAVVVESEVGYRFGIWGGATPATRERVAAVAGTSYARVRLVQALGDWAGPTADGPAAKRRAG
jgi:Transcription factor WhiB